LPNSKHQQGKRFLPCCDRLNHPEIQSTFTSAVQREDAISLFVSLLQHGWAKIETGRFK